MFMTPPFYGSRQSGCLLISHPMKSALTDADCASVLLNTIDSTSVCTSDFLV
jgi:hypothetical protein